MCPPTSPPWARGSTPWAGAAASNWERACASWRRRKWTCPPWARRRPSRLRHPRVIPDPLAERGQEVPQQRANHFDLILEPMVGVEQMQRRLVLARPSNAVLHRNDGIVPAVHDGGRAGNVLRRVLLVARHVKGRSQEK